MVTFTYSSGSILKNPEKALQKFSMDIAVERQNVLEKLKGKKVKVLLKDNEVKECYFQTADLTHFTYKLIDDNKSKKTLLKNLILRTD